MSLWLHDFPPNTYGTIDSWSILLNENENDLSPEDEMYNMRALGFKNIQIIPIV